MKRSVWTLAVVMAVAGGGNLTGQQAVRAAIRILNPTTIPDRSTIVWPGIHANGTATLVNGRTITPAGKQTALHELPLNAVLSPDGRTVLVSDDGRYDQFIQVVSVRTGAVRQTIRYPWAGPLPTKTSPRGVFVGLAYSSDGRTAYASGGQNVIHVFKVMHSGLLASKPDIGVAKPHTDPFLAGLTTTDQNHVLAVAEELSSRIAFVNTVTKKVTASVAVGQNPYGLLNLPHTGKVFVSDWGSAAVTVVNTKSGRADATIAVGAHPTAMALSPDRRHLYVSDSNADTISVIDTKRLRRVNTIFVGLLGGRVLGSSPEGLTTGPGGRRLYVANAGDNAVAVVALGDQGVAGRVAGRIPAADYPTSVAIDKKGRKLFITNGYGYGPKPDFPGGGPDPIYYNHVGGTMSVVAVPSDAQLRTYTAHVGVNNLSATRNAGSPFGARSPIKHVIYILKENKTYDSVLGDMPGGNGDPALTAYPKAVTPNLHALASEFGLYDNFYVDGRSSADGHDWAMSADATDFNMKMWPQTYSQRGQPGHYEGESAIDLSPGGYLWDDARRAGLTYRDYGEFLENSQPTHKLLPLSRAAECAGPITTSFLFLVIPRGDVLCLPPSVPYPDIPSLAGHTDQHYAGVSPEYSDVDRMREWEREFGKFVAGGNLPQLETIWLPNDHTIWPPTSGYRTARSDVALNDEAVGMLVDAVSHSKYWSSTAIFITQDDPQGAWDHVNAQRTEAFVVSPYTRTSRPQTRSGLYDDCSMLRTIEDLLGLRPMSQFDMTATPMWAGFNSKPDLRPYDLQPVQIRISTNP